MYLGVGFKLSMGGGLTGHKYEIRHMEILESKFVFEWESRQTASHLGHCKVELCNEGGQPKGCIHKPQNPAAGKTECEFE